MASKNINKPNFTQIPNIIFEYWMAVLTHAEFKLLLCICRKTFGWHREYTHISLKKLEEMTGISRGKIPEMMKTLIDHGLVIKLERISEDGDSASNEYSINVLDEEVGDQVVTSGDPPITSGDHGSHLRRPPPPEAHTYKELKKEDKEKEITSEVKKSVISAEAEEIYDFFLSSLKERKPDFKEPNKKRWLIDIDLIIRIDKRSPENLKTIIKWIGSNNFWKGVILCPSSLRGNLDRLETQIEASKEIDIIEENKTFVRDMKKQYPSRGKKVVLKDTYVINEDLGKDLMLNMDPSIFAEKLKSLFGG